MRYIRGLLCHTIIYSCGSCNVILQEPSQIRTTLLRNSLKPIFGCFSRKRLQLLIFGFSWALLYVFCLKFQAACNAAIYKVLSLLEKKCPFFACARPCFSRPNSQIWLFGRERVKRIIKIIKELIKFKVQLLRWTSHDKDYSAVKKTS